MGWTYVGGADAQGSGTSASVTHGLSIQAGDLVLAYVNSNSNSTDPAIDADAGGTWATTSTYAPPSETCRQGFSWKVATGSEPSAYSFTTGNAFWGMVVKVWRPTNTPVIDIAVAWDDNGAGVTDVYLNPYAANGRVVANNSLSVIFAGKDNRGNAEDYVSTETPWGNVVGACGPDMAVAGIDTVYATGQTINQTPNIYDDNQNDDIDDYTFSMHVSFVESAAGPEVSGDLNIGPSLAGAFSISGNTDIYGSLGLGPTLAVTPAISGSITAFGDLNLATALAGSFAVNGVTDIFGDLTLASALAVAPAIGGFIQIEGPLNLSSALGGSYAIAGSTDIFGDLALAPALAVSPTISGSVISAQVAGDLNLSAALAGGYAVEGNTTVYGSLAVAPALAVTHNIDGWVEVVGDLTLATGIVVSPAISGAVEAISGSLSLAPALAGAFAINGAEIETVEVFGDLTLAAALAGGYAVNGETTVTGSVNLAVGLSAGYAVNGLTPVTFAGILVATRISDRFTTDGTSQGIVTDGGPLFLSAVGSFGGGTLAVQYKGADGNWKTFDPAIVGQLTAPGEVHVMDFPQAINIRLQLTGATNPNLHYELAA